MNLDDIKDKMLLNSIKNTLITLRQQDNYYSNTQNIKNSDVVMIKRDLIDGNSVIHVKRITEFNNGYINIEEYYELTRYNNPYGFNVQKFNTNYVNQKIRQRVKE